MIKTNVMTRAEFTKKWNICLPTNPELFVKDFDSVIREEAEGFGEYLRKGRWVRNDDTTWIKFFFELGPEIKTTAELYDEYTKTKEK